MTSAMPSQVRSTSDVVRVWLLGGFRVSVGSRPIGGDRWRRKKAATLVKLLALSPGHQMHREQVMDLLWPHLGGEAAANNLHRTLYASRRALEPDPLTNSRCLSLQGEQLSLCPQGELWVDVEAFEQAAAAARRSRESAAYRAALDLYAGELLPEDRYEGWAEGHRGRLRETHLSLLLGLARLHEERADHDGAAEALGEVLAVDPVREEAHVGLMRLHALSGHRGEALRRYGRLGEVLSRELGAEPAAASRALREEVAAGRFPPPAGQPPAVSRPASEPDGRREGGGESPKHNLPTQRTSFVGREREMLEVKRALAMTRLLTLTGVGGSGKTRLALEVARDLVGAYPEGVWLVELAPLSKGALVPQAVAKAVKVPEQPGRPLTEALVEALRDKAMLLVVDNCEHLIDEAARLLDALLSACPLLRVVATSREVLGVEGELVWRVEPLSVPDADPDAHRASPVGELARYEAVRLFVERARLRSPRFELRAENAGAVTQICRRLEGMPLAVELAAARVRSLSVEQISRRLEDSLKLLTGDSRTAAPRQRTLRGTLDWSHDLLSIEERVLFRRLSAFAGGWTLEAAEEVVGTSEEIGEGDDVLEPLSNLVDKSLVVAEVRAGEVRRYRLLEPVRQYAMERLETSGEADAFLRRHAAFFLALAEEAEPGLMGANQQPWAERLEAEHDNLRAALSWTLEREPGMALRLAGKLARFWERRCRFLEGSGWLEAALRQGGRADAATRAKLLSEAGTFAWHRADYDRAITLHGEALGLYREVGDDGGAAFALLSLGAQYLDGKGDHERAAPFLEEALAVSRRSGDKLSTAGTLHNLAEVERQRGNYERAKTLGMQGIALAREMEDRWQLAIVVGWVGLLMVWSGDEHDLAEGFLKESLALNRELGNWAYGAYCLEGFAGLAGARRQGARAARLWGAAEALRSNLGAGVPPETRPYYECSMAAARARLGEAAWEAAFAEGMAMSSEEAAEYALFEEVSLAPEGLPVGGGTEDPLTAREREVAARVARGLSNSQIASELHLSEYTVGNHVSKILRKLEFSSRAQVAAWATERRLPGKPNAD